MQVRAGIAGHGSSYRDGWRSCDCSGLVLGRRRGIAAITRCTEIEFPWPGHTEIAVWVDRWVSPNGVLGSSGVVESNDGRSRRSSGMIELGGAAGGDCTGLVEACCELVD
ncbi:hypothetical protein M0R45_013486 [Rubus argutus]|uniref:Uncharacterized protein n=1 Tax=Rubus argutus TaxID=59490 RepID=A0AAW1XIW3_RUBAR